MIRNRRPASAVATLLLFAAVGVCGVVAVRVVRAAWETLGPPTLARTASGSAIGGASTPFTTTVISSSGGVQVDVEPARTGSNVIHLYGYTPENEPLPVVEWQGTAELPAEGIEPVAISILPITNNYAIGQVNLPAPGSWRLRFTLRISDGEQATVSVTVPIRN